MILTFLWSFASRCENVTVYLGFISFVVTYCNRSNRYSYEYTLTKNTVKDIVFQHSHVPRKCSAQCIHVSSIVLFFLSQQHWPFERLKVWTFQHTKKCQQRSPSKDMTEWFKHVVNIRTVIDYVPCETGAGSGVSEQQDLPWFPILRFRRVPILPKVLLRFVVGN